MKTITGGAILRAGALLIVSLLLLTQVAGASQQAQAPQPETAATPLISYQGTLTDESGNPIDAPVTMKFALYSASSEGTMVWGTETQTVQVADGLFSVLLGSVLPIDPGTLTGDLWLNIVVNNEQLTPRERVAGATYALAGMSDPFTVPGKLIIGPGTLSEPLQVKSSWSVLGLDTVATGQDVGIRLYENGVPKWFLLNDASEGNRLHLGAAGTVALTISQSGDGEMSLYRDLDMNGGSIRDTGELLAPAGAAVYVAGDPATYAATGWPKGGMVWASSVTHPTPGYRGAVRVDIVKDLAVGNSPFFDVHRLQSDGVAQQLLNLDESGNLDIASSITASGKGFFQGATYSEGALNVQDIGVPLTFKESEKTGKGSLWRLVLDETQVRFDSSDDGIDFSANDYHTAITMNSDGGVGCGAITENNLQTADERAAGGSDRFEEGDVLCWSAKAQRLEKCSTPDDPLVQAVADAGGRPIVMGAEQVRVIGPVRAGDYLVASSVPGYAMASSNPRFGIVIAQALEDLTGERGLIKAMIRKM